MANLNVAWLGAYGMSVGKANHQAIKKGVYRYKPFFNWYCFLLFYPITSLYRS